MVTGTILSADSRHETAAESCGEDSVLADLKSHSIHCILFRSHPVETADQKILTILLLRILQQTGEIERVRFANDTAQQRRGPSELRTPKSLHAPAVCCSDWFGVRVVATTVTCQLDWSHRGA